MPPDPFLLPLTISTLSHTSETSSRRPRHFPCLCSPFTPPPPTSPPSPTRLPVHTSALAQVSAAAAALPRQAPHPHPRSTISNVTSLTSVLASLVSELDADHRTLWCQMMDTLAARTPSDEINFAISLPSDLPSLAEQAYLNHAHALPQPAHHTVCHACAGLRPDNREFSWVDEDEDHYARGPFVPSFEAYVCDVLDEKGKARFVAERFGTARNLNTHALLSKFGQQLGMSKDEVDVAVRQCYVHRDCAEDTLLEDGDSSVSGLSDLDSLDRSDNNGRR